MSTDFEVQMGQTGVYTQLGHSGWFGMHGTSGGSMGMPLWAVSLKMPSGSNCIAKRDKPNEGMHIPKKAILNCRIDRRKLPEGQEPTESINRWGNKVQVCPSSQFHFWQYILHTPPKRPSPEKAIDEKRLE